MSQPKNNNINVPSAAQKIVSIEKNVNCLNDEAGNIILNIPVKNTSESSPLDELLQTFDLIEVKPYLTSAQITYDSLRYLSKEDIKEAIPPIGIRACFREKLFSWRKTEYGIDDETLSEAVAEKVVSWLQSQSNVATTSTPTSYFSLSGRSLKLSKSLKLILEDSPKGKSLITFGKQNGNLADSFRA